MAQERQESLEPFIRVIVGRPATPEEAAKRKDCVKLPDGQDLLIIENTRAVLSYLLELKITENSGTRIFDSASDPALVDNLQRQIAENLARPWPISPQLEAKLAADEQKAREGEYAANLIDFE